MGGCMAASGFAIHFGEGEVAAPSLTLTFFAKGGECMTRSPHLPRSNLAGPPSGVQIIGIGGVTFAGQ